MEKCRNRDLKGKIILVTDADGRVGQALVCALLERGAAKVYAAGTSEPAGGKEGFTAGRVIPIRMDVTNTTDVAAVVKQCCDVEVLFNTTSIDHRVAATGPLGVNAVRKAVRAESAGTLALCLALAPVMAARGGGLIVDFCSHASLVDKQLNGAYRESLAARNIRVIAINMRSGETLTSCRGQTGNAKLRQAIDEILSRLP